MVDKKKDKDVGLVDGVPPISTEPSEEELREQETAEKRHDVLMKNVETHTCPYHGQDLKIEREKRTVKVLDDNGFETSKQKEITVRYAVCTCKLPGANNPYRGKRVWEQT